MRIIIDHNLCRRTGQCCYLHPELFKADEEGIPEVRVEQVGEGQREAAEDAVDVCPSGAIALVEE